MRSGSLPSARGIEGVDFGGIVEEGEPTEELSVKHAVGKRTNCKSTYADVVRENMK